MHTTRSVQLVPAALTVRRTESRIVLGATPSLPQALDDGATIRVELCNVKRELVWHADYPADRVREQLSGPSGTLIVEIPTACVSDGCDLLRFHDMRTTPFFMATLELRVVDE